VCHVSLPSSYRSRRGHIHLLRVLLLVGCRSKTPTITSPEPCIAFCVDIPDCDYSLVPEAEDGGAEAELQYVEVIQDTEGTQANTADEGKPQCN
jgi:hypothetical protein